MQRRLPIYFLIDVSESMVGDQISSVEEGLAMIIKELKSDPYALETVYISIIVFAGKAKTIVPLTDIITFYPPKLSIGGGTSLGLGLGHLMYEMRKNQVLTTPETKGDWKPIVFLFTDGVSTDDTTNAIKEWKQNWGGKVNLVAVAFGDESGLYQLKDLTENVLLFDNSSNNSYKKFFKWVTASIKTSSVSVEKNSDGFGLAAIDNETVQKIDLSKGHPKTRSVDNNYAVFVAKCQNTKNLYLIKYKKQIKQSEVISEFDFSTLNYRLNGAFKIDNDYLELSDDNALEKNISTEDLEGFPACPCCGNQWGFAVCSCKKIHCSGTEKITTCPWCGNQGEYGFGNDPITINRKQG